MIRALVILTVVRGPSREGKLCLKRHSVQAERHKGRQTLTERNRLRGIPGVPLASIRERMYLAEKTSDVELSNCIADQSHFCVLSLHSVSIILVVRKYFNYPSRSKGFEVIDGNTWKCPRLSDITDHRYVKNDIRFL